MHPEVPRETKESHTAWKTDLPEQSRLRPQLSRRKNADRNIVGEDRRAHLRGALRISTHCGPSNLQDQRRNGRWSRLTQGKQSIIRDRPPRSGARGGEGGPREPREEAKKLVAKRRTGRGRTSK